MIREPHPRGHAAGPQKAQMLCLCDPGRGRQKEKGKMSCFLPERVAKVPHITPLSVSGNLDACLHRTHCKEIEGKEVSASTRGRPEGRILKHNPDLG